MLWNAFQNYLNIKTYRKAICYSFLSTMQIQKFILLSHIYKRVKTREPGKCTTAVRTPFLLQNTLYYYNATSLHNYTGELSQGAKEIIRNLSYNKWNKEIKLSLFEKIFVYLENPRIFRLTLTFDEGSQDPTNFVH